jgi:hypothetical protein
MTSLMLMGVATLVFLVAAGAIFAAAVGAFRFFGRAMNANRPGGARALYGLLSVLCFFGIFVAAGAGFAGIATLVYDAAIRDELPSL